MPTLHSNQLRWARKQRELKFAYWVIAKRLGVTEEELRAQLKAAQTKPAKPDRRAMREAARKRRALRERNNSIVRMLGSETPKFVAAVFNLSPKHVTEIARQLHRKRAQKARENASRNCRQASNK